MPNPTPSDPFKMDLEKFHALRKDPAAFNAYIGDLMEEVRKAAVRQLPTQPVPGIFDPVPSAPETDMSALFPLETASPKPHSAVQSTSTGTAPSTAERSIHSIPQSPTREVPRPSGVLIDSFKREVTHTINVAAPTIVPDVVKSTDSGDGIRGGAAPDTADSVQMAPSPRSTKPDPVGPSATDLSDAENRRIDREKQVSKLLHKDGEVL